MSKKEMKRRFPFNLTKRNGKGSDLAKGGGTREISRKSEGTPQTKQTHFADSLLKAEDIGDLTLTGKQIKKVYYSR